MKLIYVVRISRYPILPINCCLPRLFFGKSYIYYDLNTLEVVLKYRRTFFFHLTLNMLYT